MEEKKENLVIRTDKKVIKQFRILAATTGKSYGDLFEQMFGRMSDYRVSHEMRLGRYLMQTKKMLEGGKLSTTGLENRAADIEELLISCPEGEVRTNAVATLKKIKDQYVASN